MIKKVFVQLFEWTLSLIVGFLIVNIFCFAYERQPGWRDTPNGASASIREPYSYVIHGTEGYSITKVDRKGYLNPDKELAEEYILMMGTSHTQGKEVPIDKRYSTLVNDAIYDDDLLHTYNISSDGSYLTTQIKHFEAALKAFPKAKLVTIEIMSTDCEISDLKDCLNQAIYDSSDSEVYFANMSFKDRLRVLIKDSFPLILRIKSNIEAVKKSAISTERKEIDKNEYFSYVNKALALIRSETDIPIVFVYHPDITMKPDGSIELKYSQTWDMFRKACELNSIDVINSGEDFLSCYMENNELPYGFSNTSPGTGHLNVVGHKIIADEILEYVEKLK